ncbi:MAG TPA: hypothetical protein DEB39_14920 [Planctomycetaceae bacterium]|nr:hypothetical protein [Planctomycetaceae bacterium]
MLLCDKIGKSVLRLSKKPLRCKFVSLFFDRVGSVWETFSFERELFCVFCGFQGFFYLLLTTF